MAHFIKLPNEDGNTILVNVERITKVISHSSYGENHALIFFGAEQSQIKMTVNQLWEVLTDEQYTDGTLRGQF